MDHLLFIPTIDAAGDHENRKADSYYNCGRCDFCILRYVDKELVHDDSKCAQYQQNAQERVDIFLLFFAG